MTTQALLDNLEDAGCGPEFAKRFPKVEAVWLSFGQASSSTSFAFMIARISLYVRT